MHSEKQVLRQAGAWEAELNKERANGLGLTASKLEQLLVTCQALAAQLENAQLEPDVRALLLADYRKAREESERQRWKLCVQREAMGLFRHDDVERAYPVAPKR